MPRRGGALRKLLTMLCGITLFVVVVAVLGVWAIGRFAPKLLDATLASKTGAHLAVDSNDSNLFLGRLDFGGVVITNPSRWTESEFLRVKRLSLDVDTLSFLEGGSRTVHDAELDIDRLVIVGKANFLTDNNAKDIGNGLKSADKPGAPSAGPASTPPSAGRAQPFHIQHLRVRVNRITVIAGDGTPQRRIVIDREFNYVFEARDITDHNFDDKVSKPMGKLALQSAVEQRPELLMDLARERLRKSITEKLREGK